MGYKNSLKEKHNMIDFSFLHCPSNYKFYKYYTHSNEEIFWLFGLVKNLNSIHNFIIKDVYNIYVFNNIYIYIHTKEGTDLNSKLKFLYYKLV